MEEFRKTLYKSAGLRAGAHPRSKAARELEDGKNVREKPNGVKLFHPKEEGNLCLARIRFCHHFSFRSVR